MLSKMLRKYYRLGNYPWWYSKTGLWWVHWKYAHAKNNYRCWFKPHHKYKATGIYFQVGCWNCDKFWGEPTLDRYPRM